MPNQAPEAGLPDPWRTISDVITLALGLVAVALLALQVWRYFRARPMRSSRVLIYVRGCVAFLSDYLDWTEGVATAFEKKAVIDREHFAQPVPELPVLQDRAADFGELDALGEQMRHIRRLWEKERAWALSTDSEVAADNLTPQSIETSRIMAALNVAICCRETRDIARGWWRRNLLREIRRTQRDLDRRQRQVRNKVPEIMGRGCDVLDPLPGNL